MKRIFFLALLSLGLFPQKQAIAIPACSVQRSGQYMILINVENAGTLNSDFMRDENHGSRLCTFPHNDAVVTWLQVATTSNSNDARTALNNFKAKYPNYEIRMF
jgi:hypothetical protein